MSRHNKTNTSPAPPKKKVTHLGWAKFRRNLRFCTKLAVGLGLFLFAPVLTIAHSWLWLIAWPVGAAAGMTILGLPRPKKGDPLGEFESHQGRRHAGYLPFDVSGQLTHGAGHPTGALGQRDSGAGVVD